MRQFSPPMDVPPASPIKPRRGAEDFGLADWLTGRLANWPTSRFAENTP
jgi:hypothetical protein